MAEFPYLTNPGKIADFLSTIQNVGVPAKVTNKYLESIGFKSSNDRRIASVLTFIGFIDESGKPTEHWTKYRNKHISKAVLAEVVRRGYASLFSVYSDANRKDDEALKNFFTSNTTVGEKAVSFMVGTFKALSSAADFDAETPPPNGEAQLGETFTPIGKVNPQKPDNKAMTINVNLQITLPETQDEAVYDKIFEAMKKHLLS